MRMGKTFRKCLALFVLLVPFFMASEQAFSQAVTLENFQNPDEEQFPKGWDGSRSTITAKETYCPSSSRGHRVFERQGGESAGIYQKH